MNVEILGLVITVLMVIIGQTSYFAYKMGIIEKTLKVLEEKQDKHNNLIERMVRVEDSCKSAHHRLDDMNGGVK